MRRHFIDFSLFWLRILIVIIVIFFIICIVAASAIIISKVVGVLSTSSASSQAQQGSGSGQNDLTIANNLITFAGVFIAIVSVILALVGVIAAIAVFLRIRESRDIRSLRFKFEEDIKKINDKAGQVELGIDKIYQNFADLLAKVTKQAEDFENHNKSVEDSLEQLGKRIEIESQKFIEASYYYSEGSKAYRDGDNRHAIGFYLRALELQPRNLSILERIGRVYSNLNDVDNARKYLGEVLTLDPENESALRSLALDYRYTNLEKAIEYLQRIVQKNPSDVEAWDFLGLCYRDQLIRGQELIKDQAIIDKAVYAHKTALTITRRPETEFYLGILLFYSPQGDKIEAKDLMISAYKGTLEQEHDLRLRQVWKLLIHAGVFIVEDNKDEALAIVKSLKPFMTTQRISDGVKFHLRFLLEGTNHNKWLPEFIDVT